MKRQVFKVGTRALIPCLFLAQIITPIFDTISLSLAQTTQSCEQLLAEAQSKYQEGLLDESINLANSCLSQTGISLEDQEKAFKLIGKAYHAKGLLDQAKENLRRLLELIPNWQTDPAVDTPSFQRLVEQVRLELEQEKAQQQPPEEPQPKQPETQQPTRPVKKGGSKAFWFIGGGGALVAGLIIALAGGGGGGGGDDGGNGITPPVPLADPPALPPGNRQR